MQPNTGNERKRKMKRVSTEYLGGSKRKRQDLQISNRVTRPVGDCFVVCLYAYVFFLSTLTLTHALSVVVPIF